MEGIRTGSGESEWRLFVLLAELLRLREEPGAHVHAFLFQGIVEFLLERRIEIDDDASGCAMCHGRTLCNVT